MSTTEKADSNSDPKLTDHTAATTDEDDTFFFESDSLALRGNLDYSELLKTLVVLQTQRKRAILDYEKVVQLHKDALADPVSCITKLKNHETIAPDLQRIINIPNINWSKYSTTLPERYIKSLNSDTLQLDQLRADKLKATRHTAVWSSEEQKKLEELLIVYPPEDIELRRFKKIAAAMGNRTVQQVTSRIQKYFLKLHRLGLPIPGRIPKTCTSKRTHPHQRNNHFLIRPSTFFPELDIPVKMDDLDAPSSTTDPIDNGQSNNYLLPSASYIDQNTNENLDETEIQLDILRRIKDWKTTEASDDNSREFRHIGYSCDYCGEEPIVGGRWHCITCGETESVDYCTDCMLAQMYSEVSHPLSHRYLQLPNDSDVTSENATSTAMIGDNSEINDNVYSDSDTDN